MIILSSATRILALVGKELVEITRRPATLLSLIAGPFLILLIFGLGYQGTWPLVHTIVVVPSGSGLPTDPATYQGEASGLKVDAVVSDAAAAQARLRDHTVDAVIVFPANMEEQFRAGQRSTIEVNVNLIDPARIQFSRVLSEQFATRVNETIISKAVASGQEQTGAISGIPPEVVAAPTRAELVNLAPVNSGVVTFYAPAVVALILQHLCITLVAMSLIRERTSGILEIYRVGPTSAWEIVTAKVLAYGAVGAAIAAASMAFLIGVLDEPLLGAPAMIAAIIALLLAASIGIGLVVAVISDSERMAVQLSLLLLLASIFFGGFVMNLELFSWPVQVIGGLLPVTHAIRGLQDVMLLGGLRDPWSLGWLGAIAALTIVTGWGLLRRSMTART